MKPTTISSNSTAGLLAELRQQDLLREAASGRLAPAGAATPIGHRSAAHVRQRFIGRFLGIIRPTRRPVGPTGRREPLGRASGKA